MPDLYLSGSVIYDTFVLRDGSNAAVTGKTTSDFATAEAYVVATPATTATVTVAEIGSGEYRASFTPSTGGPVTAPIVWTLHVVYNSGGVFREFSGVYRVVESSSDLGASIVGSSYATLAELKARLGTSLSSNDDALTQCLEAASRAVDGFCGRRFYQDSAQTRYFTADDSGYLEVDDLVSVTTLATDSDGDRTYEDTWASTDYDLEPYNAAAIAHPYTSLMTTPDGDYAFPRGVRRGVKIVGTWGWPSVPDAITEATLLLASRLAKRQAAPFGVAAGEEGGVGIPSVDPDVRQLVAPYRRLTVGVV